MRIRDRGYGIRYPPMHPGSPANAQLGRRLRFWGSIGIVIGVTVGSGIFRTPAAIAARVPDRDAHAGGLACRRADLAVWSAVSGRAGGVAAVHRRVVRLSARGMGSACRLSLRLVGARSHQGLGDGRHFDGVQRIFPSFDGLRPGRSQHGGGSGGRGCHPLRRCRQYPRHTTRRHGRRRIKCRQVRRTGVSCAGVVRARGRRRRVNGELHRRRGAGRRGNLRPRAHFRAVGLRWYCGCLVCGRRGGRPAAQLAACDHRRHAGDRRHLPRRQRGLPLRQPC